MYGVAQRWGNENPRIGISHFTASGSRSVEAQLGALSLHTGGYNYNGKILLQKLIVTEL
jgi:hypothetical protein